MLTTDRRYTTFPFPLGDRFVPVPDLETICSLFWICDLPEIFSQATSLLVNEFPYGLLCRCRVEVGYGFVARFKLRKLFNVAATVPGEIRPSWSLIRDAKINKQNLVSVLHEWPIVLVAFTVQ